MNSVLEGKSAALVLLARGDRKLGFDRGMEHMEHSWLALNERIPPVSMEIHALVRNLMMLEPLGIHTRQVSYGIPADRTTRRRSTDLVAACGRGGGWSFSSSSILASAGRVERFPGMYGRCCHWSEACSRDR